MDAAEQVALVRGGHGAGDCAERAPGEHRVAQALGDGGEGGRGGWLVGQLVEEGEQELGSVGGGPIWVINELGVGDRGAHPD